jgi:anti-sigma factor RsiW
MSTQDPDLACRRVVEMVTDYLEGALVTDDAERLEQHLLICSACGSFVEQHRSVISALSRLASAASISAGVSDGTTPTAAAAFTPSVPKAVRDAALEAFRLYKPSPK